jgi:acyl-coenzyme A synthetase/AMP-(fatty) acid ligase
VLLTRFLICSIVGSLRKYFEKIEEVTPDLIIGKPPLLLAVKAIQFLSGGRALSTIKLFMPHYNIMSDVLESTPQYQKCFVETFAAKMSDPMMIGFTTGSTGNPKGVPMTFGMLHTQCVGWTRMLKELSGNEDIVTLHHAINFIFLDLAVGITAVIPEGNVLDQDSIDIDTVMKMVRQFKVDILAGSPILIKKFADRVMFEKYFFTFVSWFVY